MLLLNVEHSLPKQKDSITRVFHSREPLLHSSLWFTFPIVRPDAMFVQLVDAIAKLRHGAGCF